MSTGNAAPSTTSVLELQFGPGHLLMKVSDRAVTSLKPGDWVVVREDTLVPKNDTLVAVWFEGDAHLRVVRDLVYASQRSGYSDITIGDRKLIGPVVAKVTFDVGEHGEISNVQVVQSFTS